MRSEAYHLPAVMRSEAYRVPSVMRSEAYRLPPVMLSEAKHLHLSSRQTSRCRLLAALSRKPVVLSWFASLRVNWAKYRH